MADRSVLFRTSNGAFQDFATTDTLLAAGVKGSTVTISSTVSDLTLDSASKVIFDSPNSSAYDAVNERWGFGNVSPSVQWDFFSAAPGATQGHMRVRNSTGTMFEVDLQNGLVTVGSSLVPAQLRTWATTIMAALRVGSVAGDPSTLANGDVWYDTTSGKFRARENGSSVDMIGGGGSTVSPEDIWRYSLLHGVA